MKTGRTTNFLSRNNIASLKYYIRNTCTHAADCVVNGFYQSLAKLAMPTHSTTSPAWQASQATKREKGRRAMKWCLIDQTPATQKIKSHVNRRGF